MLRFSHRAIAVDLLKTENRVLPQLVPYLPAEIPEPIFIGKPSHVYSWLFAGYPDIGNMNESNTIKI
nr:hypothetical protein [Anoxybacillus caldiproteolyticus]